MLGIEPYRISAFDAESNVIQGSGKQGGTSSGGGSNAEWRSFNDKFLGQVQYITWI